MAHKIFIGLLLLWLGLEGLTAQVINVNCGDLILEGTTLQVDTLKFDCAKTLLLQKNSTLIIRESVVGYDGAIFQYGDKNDTITPPSKMIRLYRDIISDGAARVDTIKRAPSDMNPIVIFEKCIPPGIIFNDFVDYQGERCSSLGVSDWPGDGFSLIGRPVIVYDLLGRKLFEGLYFPYLMPRNTVLTVMFNFENGNTGKKSVKKVLRYVI